MIAVVASGGAYLVTIGAVAHTLTPAEFQRLAQQVIDVVQAQTATQRRPKAKRRK